jgi:hypothetical protein
MPNFSLLFFCELIMLVASFPSFFSIGAERSSLKNEFNSVLFASPLLLLEVLMADLLLSSFFFLDALLRFFEPPRLSSPPSNDEVEESSASAGLVKRSNIAGGNTAPSDNIRFPLVVVDSEVEGFRMLLLVGLAFSG